MFHPDLLGERARLTPDREALALADGSLRLTYGELDERAMRAALTLGALGLSKGDRVGLLAHNSVEFLEIFFGAAKCGVIVVPLNARSTAHEIKGIVGDCGAEILIFGAGFEEIASGLIAQRSIRRALPVAEYRDLTFMMDPSGRAFPASSPEELHCLLYTSGTTGKPKGVMIPHRMVAWNAYNTAMNWGLREDDRSPIFTPLCHAGGLFAFLTPIFAIGGTIVLHAKFDIHEVWSTLVSERCTVVLGVPTIWKLLMEAPEFATADLSSVRWLISGGAPLPAYIIAAWQKRGVVFKQGFGMTEVGVNCFSMTVEDSFRKAGSIGRPMMHTRVRLVREDGTGCAANEVGEMQIRGPHVSAGYWNNLEATAKAYGADGWFSTGDYARRDEEGFLYIAGRKKEMFISGGVNVYPAEIEAELVQHPSVSDAAVVGVEDATWGEVGVAFVVAAPGTTVRPDELDGYLAARLSRLKLPKRWIVLDTLPRTPYGKVEKLKLREML